MANSVIEQQPLETTLPVGQEIIFVVSNDTAVANQLKVKFTAEVHIGTTPINVSNADNLVATFKTTPNNAGVGIFDFKNIVENYVSSDNMASDGSKYKTTTTSDDDRHSLHIINKFSKEPIFIVNELVCLNPNWSLFIMSYCRLYGPALK